MANADDVQSVDSAEPAIDKTEPYQQTGFYVLVFPNNDDPQNHVTSDYLPRAGEIIRYGDGTFRVVEKVEHVLFDNPDLMKPRKAVPAVYVSKKKS